MNQAQGFFSSLFDFSFSSYVTPVVIRILYVLAIILILLVAVQMIIQGFDISAERGVITLIILAPLYFFVSVISVRIGLEIVMVIFRIGENVARLAGKDQIKPLGEDTGTPSPSQGSTMPPPGAAPTSSGL